MAARSKGWYARLVVRILGIVIGSVFGLVVLLVLLLQMQGFRENILDFALGRVAGALPGDLAVGESAWPKPGDLEFSGVEWSDSSGQLARADRIFLSVKLSRLLKRDLVANSLIVEQGSANIPGILQAFAPGEGRPPEPVQAERSEPSFPRAGVVPWLPSIAVGSFSITAMDIVLPDSSVIDTLAAEGSLDVSPEDGPIITLGHLIAHSRGAGWSVDHTELSLGAGWEIGGESRGMLGEGWPFQLDLDGSLDGDFSLTLLLGEESAFTEPFGARVNGKLDLMDNRIHGVQGLAEIGVPAVDELSRLPVLDELLAGFPRLGPTLMTVEGGLEFRPAFSAQGELRIHPSDWINHAEVSVQYGSGELAIDSLDVNLPDLVIGGRGSLGEEITADASALLTGVSWLEIFGVELPADSVSIELVMEMAGPVKAPAASVSLAGSLDLAGTRIEGIELRANTPGLDQPIETQFTARALETWTRFDAHVSLGEGIEVSLPPILFTAERPEGGIRREHTSRVVFTPSTGHLLVEDFEIQGDQGHVTFGASITDFKEGEANLESRWESPPYVLDYFMGEGTVDSLTARWDERGPFEVSAHATFEGVGEESSIQLTGDLALPGPATLASFLPEGAAVDSLGPFLAGYSISLQTGVEGLSFEAEFDPSATDWIDSSRILVRGDTSSLQIDDSHLEMLGVRLSAEGIREADNWGMTGRLEVTGPRIFEVVLPSAGPDATSSLVVAVSLQGTGEQPDIAATIEGELLSEIVAFEKLDGRASWNQQGLSVHLDLPQGMTIPVMMDSVRVHYRSSSKDKNPFPGTLEMDAEGPRIQLSQILHIDRDPNWVVKAETLGVSVPEGNLGTEQPFTIRLLEENAAIVVEDLSLSGTLGRISARGYADPDSSDLHADVSIAVPQEPKLGFPVPGLWPTRVDVEVRSDEAGGLLVTALGTGMKVSDQGGVEARLNVNAAQEVTEVDLLVEDGVTTFARADLRIPAHFDVYPPGWSPREGPLSGNASLENLLVAWDRLVPGSIPEQIVELEGNVELGGTSRNPTMRSNLTARLPSDPSRPDYRVDFESRLEQSSTEADSVSGISNLFATVRLVRGTTSVITGNLEFPLGILGAVGEPDTPRTIDLEIESEPLLMAELNPFLPTDYTLSGEMDLDFKASGSIDDPELSGSLVASRAGFEVARGGNASADAEILISGTGLRPRVEGNIDVIGGVIPIPENSREVLPHEGQAKLWELQGLPPLTAVPLDTLVVPEEAPRVDPDLDVTIRVPASLWIRGRQIDLELAGDLRIEYRKGAPTVTGTLRTKGGRLILLGRTFTPERGEVTFFGDDEFNPSLDVRLTSQVEQYQIIVTVTRTAREPKLELSSIPELEQSDIMSVLTFGKPAGELDGDQLELAAQRGAQMAAAWGAAEVSGSLADPLGVDMLGYNPSGRDGQSTIYVGKWLSPRALLKYEQALESGAGFFVTLEYSLYHIIRNLRIETLVGTRQSGAEVSWSRDY